MPDNAAARGEQVASFGVKSAYGQPHDVGGESVTPVALTFTGFGASASELDNGSEGIGIAVPFGVYVNREEGVRFEPNIITLLAVAIPFVCVTGRALTRIIRALKK